MVHTAVLYRISTVLCYYDVVISWHICWHHQLFRPRPVKPIDPLLTGWHNRIVSSDPWSDSWSDPCYQQWLSHQVTLRELQTEQDKYLIYWECLNNTAPQSQKAVTAYFKSKQFTTFWFCTAEYISMYLGIMAVEIHIHNYWHVMHPIFVWAMYRHSQHYPSTILEISLQNFTLLSTNCPRIHTIYCYSHIVNSMQLYNYII